MKHTFPTHYRVLSILVALTASITVPAIHVRAADEGETTVRPERLGRMLRTFRAVANDTPGKQARPEWVESAFRNALDHVKAAPDVQGLGDPDRELALAGVDEDDLGQTHVRLQQVHDGVGVVGGELIAHLGKDAEPELNGRLFEGASVETTPALTPDEALAIAEASPEMTGSVVGEPSAALVILPHRLIDREAAPGATLAYHVEIQTVGGSEKGAAHHVFYVDARTGDIVWHYDGLATVYATGNSLYSGTVSVPVTYYGYPLYTYMLYDADRRIQTVDMNNRNDFSGVSYFTSADTVFGNGSTNSRESAAVDAHFGATSAWNYFLHTHGRRGLDGNSTGVQVGVHRGSALNNAFGSRNGLSFGDGDGTQYRTLVPVDVVGHEYMHAVIDYVLPATPMSPGDGFIYANESGAIDESFSDIFGAEVEFYQNINPDYRIGEDATLSAPGCMRDMANPTTVSQFLGGQNVTYPDHYSNYWPDPSNVDNGGVHVNSSIMNHAFYRLAEGGTHPRSLLTVPSVGRHAAAKIFYLALTTRLTKAATLLDVCKATVQSAAALYGTRSAAHAATIAAWSSVGIFFMTSAPASVSWDGNRVDVFAQGLDGACWHKVWNGSQWIGWESLGGIIIDAPAVASRGFNQLDLFARGLDNQLWTRVWNGSFWTDWAPIGRPTANIYLASGPTAACSGPNRVEAVVQGTDSQVWQLTIVGSVPAGWVPRGGITYSAPGVSAAPGVIDIVARGMDNTVYEKRLVGSTWIEWASRGGVTYSAPAVLTFNSTSRDVFVRGTDNGVWAYSVRNGVSSGWYPLSGITYYAPAVSTRGGGLMDVFVRGADNTLYQKFGYGPNNWSNWLAIR